MPGVDSGLKQIRSSAWLEHYTDNVGVSSSNLLGSTAVAEALAEETLINEVLYLT
jgi:hypothetical protein